ncbi:OHCU decarboxylase domain-containing protein [Ditylenchus destructor]|uniref:OHCU decarboxylase domain-containing protein n=1 Tax=Ditylenchus destructor TaxID=166010 RepID=A0AAD4QRX8_9BILA|nr:OHCU decarboxylase domain-containing protein [Ditylenchus destructor]
MAPPAPPELTAAFKERGATRSPATAGAGSLPEHRRGHRAKRHMRLGMEAIEKLTGERAVGWYTGRDSPRTRRLVAKIRRLEYDSDYYGDDLPFWMKVQKTDGTVVPQLIVPHTLDCNDMRFALPQGYSHADPFFQYMKDSFDALYAEGDPDGDDSPKMMSIGMHCRLLGRPGASPRCSVSSTTSPATTRCGSAAPVDIARHGKTGGIPLNRSRIMSLTIAQLNAAAPAEAVALLDGIYEHSPWIAERALAARPFRSLPHLKHAFGAGAGRLVGRRAGGLIRAHPELAGKAMVRKNAHGRIYQRAEQGRPDRLHAEEFAKIQQLKGDYNAKFGFPLHPRRARPARPGGWPSARSSRPSRAGCKTPHPPSSSARRCATSTASPRSAWTKRGAADITLGNDVWDWHEQLRCTPTPAMPRRASSPSPT